MMRYRRLTTAGEGFYTVWSGTLRIPGLGTQVFLTSSDLIFPVGSFVTATAVDVPDTFIAGNVTAYGGVFLTINCTAFSGGAGDEWVINTYSPLIQGDMTFGFGSGDFLRDSPDAVAQAVWTRLRLWTGEWFLDDTEGTPYTGSVLGMGTRSTFAPAIRERILGTPGVLSITEFSSGFDGDARTAFVEATVETIYGALALSGNI